MTEPSVPYQVNTAAPDAGLRRQIRDAQLTLASCTNRPLRTLDAVTLSALLERLERALGQYRQAAAQLARARAAGNSVDLWRAIGALEQLANRSEEAI